MRPRYRACLVDDELAQLTLWEPVDPDGAVIWTEVFIREPIRVSRYLVHEVALDLIGIARLDDAIDLHKGDNARLVIARLATREPDCSTCPGCTDCLTAG